MIFPDSTSSVDIQKNRKFVPADLQVNSWESVAVFFDELTNREINNANDLRNWLLNKSELESIIQEDVAWRYIRMSCDTGNKEFQDSFNDFVTAIEPKIAPYTNRLNKKLLDSPFLNELGDSRMEIMLRTIRKQVEIFREENIPLYAELQQKEQIFAAISGSMTILHDEKEITLQQAANFLKNNNRNLRENIFRKIAERRIADKEKLDSLFDELIQLRHQIAINAGFSNFRDFMFASMGRFDYTADDCLNFHKAIEEEIMPLVNELMTKRKSQLNIEALKPWDLDVDVTGKPAPVPFEGSDEIMAKTIKCFSTIHPFLGQCIETLKELKHVDLESRIGKAPGGFNYPLYETGVPFIFMNATNSLRDLVTIVHEGGHAVHSILTKDLDYVEFRSTPSEIAELASMSMELISMEHWDQFFNDKDELKRAKIQHLEKIIESVPWIAAIDKFQHWIYTNVGHTADERRMQWKIIYAEFSSEKIDWSDLPYAFDNGWQKQLHLYQVPFYYIEYGMAQLGAIALWRNYLENPNQTVEDYFNALKLGYSATIGEVYKTAGIRFDFSKSYIRELSEFVSVQLGKLS